MHGASRRLARALLVPLAGARPTERSRRVRLCTRAMHLEASEFDPAEGLPDALDLGPAVMQRVRAGGVPERVHPHGKVAVDRVATAFAAAVAAV